MSASQPQAGEPAVSILIVSYNTHEMTLACLRSVFAETTRTPFEVILVDNQSTDGSADAIEAEFGGQIRLIRAETNLGFATANNLAAKEARGEFLLLLNPDTVVLDEAIDRLVAFARERPGAGIWGGRTLFPDRSLNPSSCWRRMTVWNLACRTAGLASLFPHSRIFNAEAYGGWVRDSVREVDIVSGCFLLIGRSLWDRLGGFDPSFFMYGEEADLCLRARALGARPAVTPEATIIHYGGASERVRADKLVRLLKAKALLIRRHMGRPHRWFALTLLAVWPLLRAMPCGVWAELRSSEQGRANAEAWMMAWRRRREWFRN